MIEVRDLSKTFPGPNGPVSAVDGIHFSVHPGEVFGLLGPNGAGKTTTLRMLCTVLRPTGGTATVAGYDVIEQPSEVRRHVGFLSANTGVYDRMTAWEMVSYYGRLNLIPPDQLRGRGKTIIFSTHVMREVEKLCDRVAIMSKGKIVVCGTLDDLRQLHNEQDLEELFFALVS